MEKREFYLITDIRSSRSKTHPRF